MLDRSVLLENGITAVTHSQMSGSLTDSKYRPLLPPRL